MNVQQMKCSDTKIAQLQGMFSVRTEQKFKFSPGVYLICSELPNLSVDEAVRLGSRAVSRWGGGDD